MFVQDLFRCLMASGRCTFEVIRQIGQRSPVRSPKKIIKMIGRGQVIPDKDAVEIGFTARRYLMSRPDAFIMLLDDLEADRVHQLVQVFRRYRDALDQTLDRRDRNRASVHFFVNMLEAYYFADADAVNKVLGTALSNHPEDVEHIRHPKNHLKKLVPSFDEIKHGVQIVKRLDVPQILSRPNTCAFLRALFSWGAKAAGETPSLKYRLTDGILSVTTGRQIGDLP